MTGISSGVGDRLSIVRLLRRGVCDLDLDLEFDFERRLRDKISNRLDGRKAESDAVPKLVSMPTCGVGSAIVAWVTLTTSCRVAIYLLIGIVYAATGSFALSTLIWTFVHCKTTC